MEYKGYVYYFEDVENYSDQGRDFGPLVVLKHKNRHGGTTSCPAKTKQAATKRFEDLVDLFLKNGIKF